MHPDTPHSFPRPPPASPVSSPSRRKPLPALKNAGRTSAGRHLFSFFTQTPPVPAPCTAQCPQRWTAAHSASRDGAPPPQQWRSAPALRGAPTARRCSAGSTPPAGPGGWFFSGNSQKGSHRVSWVPAATARMMPSVCKGVSVTGLPPLRCGPGGAVHPAAPPAPAP